MSLGRTMFSVRKALLQGLVTPNSLRACGRRQLFWNKLAAFQSQRYAFTSVTNVDETAQSFEGTPVDTFPLAPQLQRRLKQCGVETLFPVQQQTLDKALASQDIVVRARTGSGKTLGFAIPIVEMLARAGPQKVPRAIILAPTRELAKQVESEFQRIAGRLRTLSLYGGAPMSGQERALRSGVDIVVGTPGRVMDHLQRGTLSLKQIEFAVLDEADDMLNMGFLQDVETIYSYLPQPVNLSGASDSTHDMNTPRIHHMLWSATVPDWVRNLARRFLHQPEFVDLVGDSAPKLPSTVRHGALIVWDGHRSSDVDTSTRQQVLVNALEQFAVNGRVLVFTETKSEAAQLANIRTRSNITIASLTGDLSQSVRESTLIGFKNGSINVICATDVAARGLDIPSVDAVVHYRLPRSVESFVHRTGRTGRAGRSGVNIALYSRSQWADVTGLSRELGFNWQYIHPSRMEQLKPADTTDTIDDSHLKNQEQQATLNNFTRHVGRILRTNNSDTSAGVSLRTRQIPSMQGSIVSTTLDTLVQRAGSVEDALRAVIAAQLMDTNQSLLQSSLLTGRPGIMTLFYQPSEIQGAYQQRVNENNGAQISVGRSSFPQLAPRNAIAQFESFLRKAGLRSIRFDETSMFFAKPGEDGSITAPGLVFDCPAREANVILEFAKGDLIELETLPNSVINALMGPKRSGGKLLNGLPNNNHRNRRHTSRRSDRRDSFSSGPRGGGNARRSHHSPGRFNEQFSESNFQHQKHMRKHDRQDGSRHRQDGSRHRHDGARRSSDSFKPRSRSASYGNSMPNRSSYRSSAIHEAYI